jgi:hypothetical protein
VLDNRFGHQGNDLASIGVEQGCPQHLVGIRHGAISVMAFSTRLAVNLLGGKVTRTIEG